MATLQVILRGSLLPGHGITGRVMNQQLMEEAGLSLSLEQHGLELWGFVSGPGA